MPRPSNALHAFQSGSFLAASSSAASLQPPQQVRSITGKKRKPAYLRNTPAGQSKDWMPPLFSGKGVHTPDEVCLWIELFDEHVPKDQFGNPKEPTAQTWRAMLMDWTMHVRLSCARGDLKNLHLVSKNQLKCFYNETRRNQRDAQHLYATALARHGNTMLPNKHLGSNT